MASSLTSASLKSGFLYLIFLAFIIFGVIYLLFFQQTNVIDNLNRQAFNLNFAAFKNAIQLANYRFLTSHKIHGQTNFINLWVDGKDGLDYNKTGFPIGTNITNPKQQTPLSSLDCLQLWQFVLGPQQPSISIKPNVADYWVELNINNICVYHFSNIHELVIFYAPNSGKVSLNNIN